MQLQATLCYSFNYHMIFITIFKIEPIVYSLRASLPYPHPNEKLWVRTWVYEIL